jgi:uncharacterized glyoxalase superfamily protein PhnB
LAVDDCEAALRRARAGGATVVATAARLVHGGRVGAVIDPLGAPFYCWQPTLQATAVATPPKPGLRPSRRTATG